MKKVIFCLLVPFLFQQCTEELHEIDEVILESDPSVSYNALTLDQGDVPDNAFTAFYYFGNGDRTRIEHKIEREIDYEFLQSKEGDQEFAAYWEGYFDFESGDYEVILPTDNSMKVFVDGVSIVDGEDSHINSYVKIRRSFDGIRHLKIFYNLNSKSKIEKILEYYEGLRNSPEVGDDYVPTKVSRIISNAKDKASSSEVQTLLAWQLIQHR